MKIGIYNEASRSGNTFDGSDKLAATLADVLARSQGARHQVEFVHHKPHLSREHLERFCGMSLEPVSFRFVPDEGESPASSRNPVRRYQGERGWMASLSTPYDLFINFVHGLPPFCHARRGVMIVLFPFFDPFYIWPAGHAGSVAQPSLDASRWRRKVERPYHFWEWKQRMDSYTLKLSISGFVQAWTSQRWGVPSHVLYPPADTAFDEVPKEDLVLSVGRFAVGGVLKRQFEMVDSWAQLQGPLQGPGLQGLEGALQGVPASWNYVCTGSSGAGPEEEVYTQNVRALGQACGAQVEANAEWDKLRGWYERAKIFWHAAGLGVDESRRPQEVEHFGIVTVEAMAAGCVPLVINKGGPAEVVRHGVDGFVCEDMAGLRHYTSLLARNEPLRQQMSRAARERAQGFSHEAFARRFEQLAAGLLS